MCLDFLPGFWQFPSRRYAQGSKVEFFARTLFQELHDLVSTETGSAQFTWKRFSFRTEKL